MLPNLLTSKDIKQYLHIGNDKCYALMKSPTFPSFQIASGEFKVREDRFLEWIDKESRKKVTRFK